MLLIIFLPATRPHRNRDYEGHLHNQNRYRERDQPEGDAKENYLQIFIHLITCPFQISIVRSSSSLIKFFQQIYLFDRRLSWYDFDDDNG